MYLKDTHAKDGLDKGTNNNNLYSINGKYFFSGMGNIIASRKKEKRKKILNASISYLFLSYVCRRKTKKQVIK